MWRLHDSYSRAAIFGSFGINYNPQQQYLNTGLSPQMPDGGYCIFITLDKSTLNEAAYAYEDVLDSSTLTWITRKDRTETDPDYVAIQSGVRTSLFARWRARDDFAYLGEVQYRAHRQFVAEDGRVQQEYFFDLRAEVPAALLVALTAPNGAGQGISNNGDEEAADVNRRLAKRQAAVMTKYRRAFTYAVDRAERVTEPRHQHYQVRLRAHMNGLVVDLECERDFVDVRFVLGGRQYIGEIKITDPLRLEEAYRTALGQLLEYAHLKFDEPPAMVMFLDKPLDAKRLALANVLGIAVVVEKRQSFCLQLAESDGMPHPLQSVFPPLASGGEPRLRRGIDP